MSRITKYLSRRRSIGITLVLLAAFVATMVAVIAIKGQLNTVTFREDCVLVLGGGIRHGKVSATLKSRLDKCLEYLQHNPNALVVVSGGRLKKEKISEAQAMQLYLVQHGVRAAQILQEDQSLDTKQNMRFSKRLLDSCFQQRGHPNYTLACITSHSHLYRSSLLAAQNGLRATYWDAGTLWYRAPYSYGREVLSFCKLWLLLPWDGTHP